MEISEAKRQLIEAGRYLLENDLTWGSAGNLSVRLASDSYLVTASGTDLGLLNEDDFVVAPLDRRAAAPPGRKPSKETPMHRAIYVERPEIGAVLHASPFYSTLVACSGLGVPGNLFVENMYYLERVTRVPYSHPGSARLGEEVCSRAGDANVLLLENHGVLVYDTTVREALLGLHALEFTCRMLIEAGRAGLELRSLPGATVQDFLENSGYRPRRKRSS
jgi:L-fuculose-phosphate aldolase